MQYSFTEKTHAASLKKSDLYKVIGLKCPGSHMIVMKNLLTNHIQSKFCIQTTNGNIWVSISWKL